MSSGRQGVQVLRQICQIRERANRQKIVHIRQRDLQSSRQRRVVRSTYQRVEPDQATAASSQPLHLGAEDGGIPAIPSIGNEQHDEASTR